MTKTLIRHAVSSDFPVLLGIDVASFPPGVAYNSAELSYFMNRPGSETLVLEAEGVIAGFLIIEVHPNRRFATIVTLDVREGHRRMGHATKLFEKAEEILESHGVEMCDLQVDVSNTGAIRFYKLKGFTTVRRLREYYANGNDAWLMVKELRTGV
jgi:ribosomal-protein-alanine N-acetyltransferase